MKAVDNFLNNYKGTAFIIVVVIVAFAYLVAISCSISPAYLILSKAFDMVEHSHIVIKAFSFGAAFAVAYLAFAITLIIAVAILNWLMPFKVKPWRGRYYSLNVVPWYYHNALVQLVRYTVLDLLTPSPINVVFFRLMGMKMGKGCIINTSNISDPCLIELGDYVTIGGSATIFAHYAQAGFIVLAPVKLESGCTIGLKSSIMGDVIIGENVLVKPHEVILPKTRLAKRERKSRKDSDNVID